MYGLRDILSGLGKHDVLSALDRVVCPSLDGGFVFLAILWGEDLVFGEDGGDVCNHV